MESRTTYYRHLNKNEEYTLTEVENRIHQLCIGNHFLYGYRKIHALLTKDSSVKCSVSKVKSIMSRHGWDCCFKQKRFNKPGNPYKTFENLVNRD